jgi:hypothetical protein
MLHAATRQEKRNSCEEAACEKKIRAWGIISPGWLIEYRRPTGI